MFTKVERLAKTLCNWVAIWQTYTDDQMAYIVLIKYYSICHLGFPGQLKATHLHTIMLKLLGVLSYKNIDI